MKDWAKSIWDRRRARLLALTGLVTICGILLLEWITSWLSDDGLREFMHKSRVFGPLFFPDTTPDWKDRLQGVLLLLGLPVAFLLWHWRDRNVRDQIDNQRKDINLKEFQEVQLRAAGALDEKLPKEAREQLQIAALQQLRGFIRGEYGDAFRRPAFELLLSGHAAAMERIGTRASVDWTKGQPNSDAIFKEVQKLVSELRDRLDPVTRERIRIIKDDWETLVATGFPLHHRNFDLVDLQQKDFSGLTIFHCSFVGARLGQSNFTDTKFWSTNLIGVNLIGATLDRANLASNRCEGADFSNSSCRHTIFHGALCRGARFMACKMFDADIRKLNFSGAALDGLQLDESDQGYINLTFLKNLGNIANKFQHRPDLLKQPPSQNVLEAIETELRQGPWPGSYDDEKMASVRKRLLEKGATLEP